MQNSPTARRITEEAGRLLDCEGPEAVTMRRVARAAGITAMAVYRHFADHAALLNALADEGFETLAARVSSAEQTRPIEKRLTKILDLYLDFALERPRLFELMFLIRREGARRYPADFRAGQSPTANLAAAALVEGIQRGIFRRVDVWEITFEMGALLQGLVMLYLGGRMDMSAEGFRAFCHRSFRRYLRAIRK